MSPYGLYESSWQIDQGKLKLKARVPPNASAQIELPGLSETIGSGVYEFEVDWVPDERWPPKGIQLPCTQPMIDRYV
jgi:alpha-L-rhamnosidase